MVEPTFQELQQDFRMIRVRFQQAETIEEKRYLIAAMRTIIQQTDKIMARQKSRLACPQPAGD